MKKLMIFDMDGTLNQTETYGLPAMRQSLQELGFSHVSDQTIMKSIGASDEDTNRVFFGDKEKEYADIFWNRVSEVVHEKYLDAYCTFPGITEMLEELKEKGWLLAICSNAESEQAVITTAQRLKISHLMDFFQSIEGWKDKNSSLQALLRLVKPDKAVMVGDRFYDKEAAAFNKIPFAACLYGYGEKEELEGADYYLEEPLDLLRCEEVLR